MCPGEYSLQWPIRGDSTRKGYLFQSSGIWKGTVRISQVEAYERVGKFVIWVYEGPKGPTDEFYGIKKLGKRSIFVIDSYLNANAFKAVERDAKF